MLIGDCASDPPLAATQRTLAAARADDVVYGLGAVALARGHRQLALAVADEGARAALARAIAELGAEVQLIDVADAWPAVAAGAKDEVLPASALVAVADEARGRGAAAMVSVVGAVAEPALVACAPSTTMAELAARAGGALDEDWLPIAGGAPAGRLVAREATMAEVGMTAVVLLLPARHEWVRRLRTTVGDWLWRAASACEGCRACSEGCPVGLEVKGLVATLVTGREDGTRPAAFVACSGCGVCDAVCPAGLSPRALAVDVRERLARGGVAGTAGTATGTVKEGIDRALLTLRLGLSAYDRQLVVRLA
jgi:ferredoxin